MQIILEHPLHNLSMSATSWLRKIWDSPTQRLFVLLIYEISMLLFYYIFFSFLVFRQQKKYHRSPDKSDISSPCGFEHLVSIGSRDYAKFFSLQTFVNNNTKRNLWKKNPKTHHYGKTKWAPQPPRREVAWFAQLNFSLKCQKKKYYLPFLKG